MSQRLPTGYSESELYKLYPELYMAIFVDKRNVLISGIGGTGKTFSLGLIKQESVRLGLQCDLTSTTGVSAHSIGGQTIHRWSSIRLGDKPVDIIVKNIKKNADSMNRWKNVDILIIDEASMLGSSILTLLSQIGKRIRLKKRGTKLLSDTLPPFGDVQVILSADFMQLLPINDELAFKSSVWAELKFYYFRVVHPYRYPDIKHFEMLSRIRVGEQTEDDIKLLKSRVVAHDEYRKRERESVVGDIKPTRLYPRKNDVQSMNLTELDKLPGDCIAYEATDTIIVKTTKSGKPVVELYTINNEEYIEYMDSIVSPEVLLKEGAQVMLTVNLSVEDGLVNGSRGVVLACHDERVTVKFKCGLEQDIVPYNYEYEDEKVTVVRCQFPLILAYAVSIHKSQGCTLDYAIIDLGTSLFCPALGYVALSRCKTLEGIYIINIIPDKIKADPTALAFEKELVKMSTLARRIDVKRGDDTNDKKDDTRDDKNDLSKIESVEEQERPEGQEAKDTFRSFDIPKTLPKHIRAQIEDSTKNILKNKQTDENKVQEMMNMSDKQLIESMTKMSYSETSTDEMGFLIKDHPELMEKMQEVTSKYAKAITTAAILVTCNGETK